MTTVARYFLKWDALVLTCVSGRAPEKPGLWLVRWISHSADGQAYPALLILLAVFQSERWRVLSVFLFSFAIELAAYKLIKHWVKRPRPFHQLDGMVNLIASQDFFSFPSGHTAGAVVVALSVAYCYPSLAFPAYLWAASVGFSRIYLRVHYPTDVLAGACLGILSVKLGLTVGISLIASSSL